MAALLVTTGQVQVEYLMLYVLPTVGLFAIDMPVGRTLVYQVVGKSRLTGAIAAQSVAANLVNIAAPISFVVAIGIVGSGASFGVLGAGYLLAAILILRTRVGVKTPERRLTSVLRRSWRALVSLAFLVSLAGVHFAIVPVYARDILDSGASGHRSWWLRRSSVPWRVYHGFLAARQETPRVRGRLPEAFQRFSQRKRSFTTWSMKRKWRFEMWGARADLAIAEFQDMKMERALGRRGLLKSVAHTIRQ